jgi:hypothetical protein
LFPLAYGKESKEIHVNHVPGLDAFEQEFFYATELSEPHCAIRSRTTSRVFSIRFSNEDMKSVWAFGSYGRWRGHFVLILEPCTDAEYDMAKAHENGTCALLQPKERREISVYTRLETALTPAFQMRSSKPMEMPQRAIVPAGKRQEAPDGKERY